MVYVNVAHGLGGPQARLNSGEWTKLKSG